MSLVRGEPKFGGVQEGCAGNSNDRLYVNDQVSYRRSVLPNAQIRKQKLYVSSLREKATSDLPEAFTVTIPTKYTNVVGIRFIQIGVNYTPTATLIQNAFIHIPEFDHSELTSANDRYHAFFPVTQGSAGTPLYFHFNFNDHYLLDFPSPQTIQNKLRVNVYREDTTSGDFVAFAELNRFSVEMEIHYIDPY